MQHRFPDARQEISTGMKTRHPLMLRARVLQSDLEPFDLLRQNQVRRIEIS